MEKFRALVVREENGSFKRAIEFVDFDFLPKNEVLIKVRYSALNYKDALSATGHKGVTTNYPHIPGIDAAGIVIESSSSEFKEGDKVLVTGFDLGMNTPGGFGEYIRVPANWIIKLPEKLTLKESMIYGTAGLTAGLSVYRLIQAGLIPEKGPVVVTGATGGVGSIAIMILSKLGFNVVAVTGKKEKENYLKKIGAKEVILREEFEDQTGKPLLKGKWAAGVDTVSGNILSTLIRSIAYGGFLSVCGNVASSEFRTSIFPFILRGISMFGIDSAMCPMELRKIVWDKLAEEWKPKNLEDIAQEVSLEELNKRIDLILAGKLWGRTILNLEL